MDRHEGQAAAGWAPLERPSTDHISLSERVQGQGQSRPGPGRKWPGGEQDNCSETQSGIRAKGVSGVSLTARAAFVQADQHDLGPAEAREPRAPQSVFL